jgi:hypothetical protein
VDEFRSKGLHMAREFNRAHILAALDRQMPERLIMEVLNVGRTAVWRTRAAPPADENDQPRGHPADLKKNVLKPWRKLMWCIGEHARCTW